VYARHAGTWKPAVYVWARENGVWRVIWGAEVSPPVTPVATWVAPHSVRIDWALPTPNTATQWIIRRSDNTEVGRVASTVTTITDPTPRVLPSGEFPTSVGLTYTLAGTDGTTETARVTSNVLTVSLDPATVTPTASYPSAASNSVARPASSAMGL